MSVTVHNPYADLSEGRWVRGNFHTHCRENSGCASVEFFQVVRLYRNIGAEFLAFTDHDTVTDLSRVRNAYPEMAFLEGFEHSRDEHMLFIGETVEPLFALPAPEALHRAEHLLTIMCHPEPWPGEAYWTLDKLNRLPRRPDGLEIYDGHYGISKKIMNGANPLYTRRWDEFLTAGVRLWGYCNDDFHEPEDFNNAFNMVWVRYLTATEVVRSAKAGRCYGSTGLILDSISERNGRITIRTAAAGTGTGRFIGPEGKVLSQTQGRDFEYQLTNEPYIRFEAEAAEGNLYLQPFFQISLA